MMKKNRILKWSLITLTSLVILFASLYGLGMWFGGLIYPAGVPQKDFKTSLAKEIPYLSEDIIPTRGKILAVVTSCDMMGTSEKKYRL